MKAAILIVCFLVSSTLAQELVQVACAQDRIEAKIKKQVVKSAGFEIGQLHFNDKSCVFNQEDDEFYIFEISPLSNCLTHQVVNDTHVTYSNSISTVETGPTFPYGVLAGPSATAKVLSAKITCTFRIDLNVSTMFTPNITIIPIPVPDAYGVGEFQATMSIYTDATYSTQYYEPPTLQADETLFVGVRLLGTVSEDVYLLIQDCWGTISDDPLASPKYPLITDGCAVSTAADGAVEVGQNGNSHQGMWNSPVFKFVGADESFNNVWLHCDLQICINKPCQPTCPARRKRRDVSDESKAKKLYGPDDHTQRNMISIGPVVRLVVENIPSDQIRTTYVEKIGDGQGYLKVQANPSPNDRAVLSPTIIAVIAVMGALAFICIMMAIFVIAYRSRGSGSSHPISLSGVSNKGFAA